MISIKLTCTLLAAAIVAASPTAVQQDTGSETIRVQYYPNHKCTEANHFAQLKLDECYGPIFNFAESFHAHIPKGYQITGWASEDCSGSSPVVVASGPDEGKCFITGVFMGQVAGAQSFILEKE